MAVKKNVLFQFSLKPRILYELGRQPSKTQKLIKEKFNSSSYEQFKKEEEKEKERFSLTRLC